MARRRRLHRRIDVADLALAADGEQRIAWAASQMPVLARIAGGSASERPLDGIRIAACLHVTAETANLVRALKAGGAQVGAVLGQPAVDPGRCRAPRSSE